MEMLYQKARMELAGEMPGLYKLWNFGLQPFIYMLMSCFHGTGRWEADAKKTPPQAQQKEGALTVNMAGSDQTVAISTLFGQSATIEVAFCVSALNSPNCGSDITMTAKRSEPPHCDLASVRTTVILSEKTMTGRERADVEKLARGLPDPEATNDVVRKRKKCCLAIEQ